MSPTSGSAAILSPEKDTVLPLVVGVTSTLWFIALTTCIMRIYTRCRPYLNLSWDDLAIGMAMLLTTVNWACNVGIQVATGGRHVQYIPLSRLELASHLGFITMVVWIWALTALKVSVALMLLRIKQTPRWRKGIWLLITLLVVVGIGCTCAQIFQCSPVEANWNILLRWSGRNCWTRERQEMVTYSVSALFAATDITCALLPLLFIVKINRPLREKVTLCLLMAMGLLACVCGLVKTALVKRILDSNDPVWEGHSVAIWTYAEESIGITAANIPCLKSLLEAAFKSLGGHVTNLTSSEAKTGSHDLESFPLPQHELSSTLTPLNRTYNTSSTRSEEDSVGYHTSLRETSMLQTLERNGNRGIPSLKIKGMRERGNGFEFDFMGDEKGQFSTTQVTINGKRVDRYDSE